MPLQPTLVTQIFQKGSLTQSVLQKNLSVYLVLSRRETNRQYTQLEFDTPPTPKTMPSGVTLLYTKIIYMNNYILRCFSSCTQALINKRTTLHRTSHTVLDVSFPHHYSDNRDSTGPHCCSPLAPHICVIHVIPVLTPVKYNLIIVKFSPTTAVDFGRPTTCGHNLLLFHASNSTDKMCSFFPQ